MSRETENFSVLWIRRQYSEERLVELGSTVGVIPNLSTGNCKNIWLAAVLSSKITFNRMWIYSEFLSTSGSLAPIVQNTRGGHLVPEQTDQRVKESYVRIPKSQRHLAPVTRIIQKWCTIILRRTGLILKPLWPQQNSRRVWNSTDCKPEDKHGVSQAP